MNSVAYFSRDHLQVDAFNFFNLCNIFLLAFSLAVTRIKYLVIALIQVTVVMIEKSDANNTTKAATKLSEECSFIRLVLLKIVCKPTR